MMAEVAPISAVPPGGSAPPSAQTTAANAFGLGFQDLLRIVLTQLTYQDPLKPVENFEFVSQLAQFTQIQQSETSNDHLQSMLNAQSTSEATSMLGRQIDIPSGSSVLTGLVKSISFLSGEPKLTIETADNHTITDIALSSVSRIAAGE